MASKMHQETRTAMQELVQELDRTRKEYAKSTLQVTQLETLVEHMRDSEMKKDAVVRHLEEELENVRRLHQQEVLILTEEFRTKESALQHAVQHLQLELNRVVEENKVMSGYEHECRQLRDAVLESQAKLERLQQINDDLKARVKEDMRDFRSNLEAEFKKRLMESEKKFRSEAYKALSEEAKVALQGNDQLQSVLQRQNDSIESVLLRCKQLETTHTKLRGEQESSQQNLQHHISEVTRLRKQLTDTKAKNTQLEDVLRQRKVERASLELLFVEYEATRKQLTRVQEKSKRHMREAERWKARAMQLSYDVTGVADSNDTMGTAGEQRLNKARQQIRDVEASLQNNRHGRSAMRRKPGEEARAKGSMGDDWSDVSDNAEGPEDGQPMKSTITPMEILAMWNVNFETWKDGGAQQPTTGQEPASPIRASSPDSGQDTAPVEVPSLVAVGTPKPLPSLDAHVRERASPPQSALKGSSHIVPPSAPPMPNSYEASTLASHKKSRRKLTVEEARAEAERNLSVVSQRRYRSIPFAMQRSHLAQREVRPISMSELSVVGNDGTFHKVSYGANNPSNARFIVP